MYTPHATVNTRLLTKPDLNHISAALYELHAQKMDVPEIKQVITAYKKNNRLQVSSCGTVSGNMQFVILVQQRRESSTICCRLTRTV